MTQYGWFGNDGNRVEMLLYDIKIRCANLFKKPLNEYVVSATNARMENAKSI